MGSSVLGYETPIIGHPYNPPRDSSATSVLGGHAASASSKKKGTATILAADEPGELADFTPIERELRNGEEVDSPEMSSVITHFSEELHPAGPSEIERVAAHRALI